tara:strand:- start:471 stop:650 length:180 start_codon:yes stop_codon:yes gene_type:complete
MSIAIDIILGSITFFVLTVIIFFSWDYYKERQWRKRNPDEWIRLESLRRGFYKRNKWDD